MQGVGVDVVFIMVFIKSNEVIVQVVQMSCKWGWIVLVGVIGLDIQWFDFYEKELIFQVFCFYGLGCYDDVYE